MKSFIISLCFIATFAAADHLNMERLMASREQCKAEFNIGPHYIEEYIVTHHEYPNDSFMPCYIQCVLQRMGVFDPYKGFDEQYLVNMLHEYGADEDVMKAHVHSCNDGNKLKTDTCLWAQRFFECFLHKHPNLGKTILAMQ
ncbi:general odorant-binding protein 99a [Teleopsis dalmanni]|uniref:general odorant-binding protein 99a n=1 Tax=Teleopsis dalmanni TaxID=139649 RepID=UPI0018CE8409|nr:general odorant-binding protein 99a [Teleopsis dalmanni]